jgi:hypothetical protein
MVVILEARAFKEEFLGQKVYQLVDRLQINSQPTIGGSKGKGKGKATLLQAWTGPLGSRRLRLPYFKTVGT